MLSSYAMLLPASDMCSFGTWVVLAEMVRRIVIYDTLRLLYLMEDGHEVFVLEWSYQSALIG